MQLQFIGSRLSLCLLVSLVKSSSGIFAEDAGELDFLVSTSGHGLPTFATVYKDSVITSDPQEDDGKASSCYVASRHISDGSLKWRRNVCSSTSEAGHTLSILNDVLVTLDNDKVARSWDLASGTLLFDKKLNGKASAWPFESDGKTYVALSDASGVATYNKLGKAASDVKVASASKSALKMASEASCPDASLSAAFEDNAIVVKAGGNALTVEPQISITPDDAFVSVTTLMCSTTSMVALYVTRRGTVKAISVIKGKVEESWAVEEGMASIISALLLDASHSAAALEDEKKENMLQFLPRIKSQLNAVTSILDSTRASQADDAFGFVKVALLLSNTSNRLYGMDTTGPQRAKTRYTVDLPEEATWHRLVHGDSNGKATTSRDVLVLSLVRKNELHYKCIEGTTGLHRGAGTVKVESTVVQVVPVSLSGGSCHQGAVLMLEDDSSVAVPTEAQEVFWNQISEKENGFYFHFIDNDAGLKSLELEAGPGGSLVPTEVGSLTFPGESIVDVTYPQRGEVIQSPCHIMGDSSLLLKYQSQHIAVIVTMSDDVQPDELDERLRLGKTPKKPTGAASPQEAAGSEAPNLFVNVVDTVSGRVIFRVSHKNADESPLPQVVISENWVFYTFMNKKTRRSEIGVLTLYEGQIHESGLTAFTSPDRSSTISSLDATDSKPVVLTKTYSTPKGVVALGVTTSRGGIGNRRLILATMDGQIFAVDRKMLDTRRPIGEVNEMEKKEGLQQYNEIIPNVSYMSLTYTQNVDSVKSILSSATDLESQTLLLAYGGPDIFFCRTSPSRGFDLLPESFNKPMLAIVVTLLLVALLSVKQMADSKSKKQGWV